MIGCRRMERAKTSKERFLRAMQNQEPDRVPATPDIGEKQAPCGTLALCATHTRYYNNFTEDYSGFRFAGSK